MESRSYLQHTICLSSSYRNYTTERFVVLNISSPSVSGTPSTFKWLFGLLKTFFNHWLQSCCFFKAGFMLSLESFSKHTHTLEGVCPPWSLSTRVNLKSSTLYFLNVSCFGTFTDSLCFFSAESHLDSEASAAVIIKTVLMLIPGLLLTLCKHTQYRLSLLFYTCTLEWSTTQWVCHRRHRHCWFVYC